MEQLLNSTIPNAQHIFSQKEKALWDNFFKVRDTKYTGKGSRATRKQAVDDARKHLKIELEKIEDDYARAVGASK